MKSIQYLVVVAATLMLAACGGGSSNNSFGGGGTASLTVTVASSTVTVNPQNFAPDPDSPYTTQVTVIFRDASGQPVADGTTVTLSSSSVARGVVSPIDAPTATGSSATNATAGGRAQFWFTAGSQTGTVTLTASAANPSGGTGITAAATINVEPGVGNDDRLTVSGSSTIPTNTQGVPIFLGSPFINELTIQYVGANGQPGSPADGEIGVAISPISRGAFSTLDDPETTDVNEFFSLLGSGPVDMTAGVSTIFVHSFDQPGPLTVSVSLVDANTGEQFSTEFVVNVEDGAANFLPSQVDFSVDPEPIYAQGAGGASSKNLQIIVRDSGGNPVPNPEADGVSWNNIRLTLDSPAGSGARLVGTGAGGSVSGSEISVRTVNGIANISLDAGSEVGTHRIVAVVDRADNNVDQGTSDALQTETTIEVGDGRLFALELVSPILNAIRVNPTVNGVSTSFELIEDDLTGALVPADPDGTYSLTVTVQGTDQVGNPVLPGTVVNFGKIDDPMLPGLPRLFVFSGVDGNPQEGGNLFSVFDPFEGFLDDPVRVDDAVESGDTVALFGKLVPGNREHEAVRFVSSVVDENTVNVTEPFNPNDQSGSIVNDGFVIPWVIGRSRVGNIEQSVVLDDFGRGSVQMTYPINALGRPIVLWSQGTRILEGGNKTVADVEAAVFPGVAPLLLTASPSAITANNDTVVRLCLTDGLRSPIEGAFIVGAITEGAANGSLDGSPMTTTTANATGSAGAGCVDTVVNISGIPPEGDEATITFSYDEATAEVSVVPPGAAMLLVDPSVITDTSLTTFSRRIDLTLLDGDGEPISGAQLVGECETDGGILSLSVNPGVTDANGETSASVLVGMAGCGTDGGEYPRLGTCTFTTTSGTPEGVLQVIGIDVLTLGISPPPVGCPPEEGGDTQILVVRVEDNRPDPQPSSLVESIPTGISCTAGSTIGDPNCQSDFAAGTTVIVRAPAGTTPVFSGACGPQAGSDPNFGEAILTNDIQTCVVTFN
ncbi:Ig-like domain-containing protein [Wenzhouxiangella marina]|nr:Ig-like domain-containing protein [Wenzhouxiangella marina]MBB6087478.1 hypothetical protein [Wenzhouxiangella marina]